MGLIRKGIGGIEYEVPLTWDFRVAYMSFSRLSSFLRLPLVVLICGQLVYLGGNFALGGYFVLSVEEVVASDERDDKKFFDSGVPVTTFKDALSRHANKVSLGLGYMPRDVALELRATGPPNV